jgi:hypothetical protein
MSNVTITLAHPLPPEDAARLDLPTDVDYRPGDKIVVGAGYAQSLIGAGYAAVDPEDPDAARKARNRRAPAGHPVGLLQAADNDDSPQVPEPPNVEPSATSSGVTTTDAGAPSSPVAAAKRASRA